LVLAILQQTPDLTYLDIPPALKDVVAKLLAKESHVRFSDASAAIQAFCAAMERPLPPETPVMRESFLQAAPFIGRQAESAQLLAALEQARAGKGSAWLVEGESGIGKSRLLQELRTRALVGGVLVLRGQAQPEGGGVYHLWTEVLRPLLLQHLLTAVPDLPMCLVGSCRPGERPSLPQQLSAMQPLRLIRLAQTIVAELSAAMLGENGRFLLLIDTTELLTPLDGWLHDNFLPQLPDNMLVIIAGRYPPSLRWRTDPGWQQLMHVLPLHNLTQEESRALLMRRQVPAREHEAVLRFTHGHPLALSLVADVFTQQPDTQFQPENAPDIIKTLLEQFMQDVPSPDHRAALEACSQVRLLNEALLGAMLELDDPHSVFEWLRTLSFIDAERRGLFPHDLAREALAADLHWRNPLRQARLHDRARSYYIARFQQGNAREQRQVLSDYIFLHRDNPMIRPYFEWQATGTIFTDVFRPEDRETILEMIGRHEGQTARAIAIHWLARQPEGVVVLRQADGAPQGVLMMVSLEKTNEADWMRDPGTAVAWDYLRQHAPLRAGETATLFRFWMAQDTYQAVSPVQSRIFLNIVQHYLTVPGLAFTMIPCAEPEFWSVVFAFADQRLLPEASFRVEERQFSVYGHDWRVMPPLIWLELMAERELGQLSAYPQAPRTQVQVLDEKAFAEAVREALRNYGDLAALAENPLLYSRVVTAALAADGKNRQRVELLQMNLRETAVSL